MLSKQDEEKLNNWVKRQVEKANEKYKVEIKPIIKIEMDKSLEWNRESIVEALKEEIKSKVSELNETDNTNKQERKKSPFKNMTYAEYKNIKSQ